MKKYFILIGVLLGYAGFCYSAPPVTIWNKDNSASVFISTVTGALRTNVIDSTITAIINNFPTDYPDAGANSKLTILISTANALFKAGQNIGNTHFDTSGSTIVVGNFPATQKVADERYKGKVSDGIADFISGYTAYSVNPAGKVSHYTFIYFNEADESAYATLTSNLFSGKIGLRDGIGVSKSVDQPKDNVTFYLTDLSPSATVQYIITTLIDE